MKATTDFDQLIQPLLCAVEEQGQAHLGTDRVLVPLVAMVVQGTTSAIDSQVQQALQIGVVPEKILEVVYQLAPVVGSLKVRDAVAEIQAMLMRNDVTVEAPQMRTEEDFGAQVQADLYGTEIKHLLQDLPDHAGDFIASSLTEHFFNDHYARLALTVQERERFELMALITLNVDFQINAHARGSIKAGNTESELIWSALQLLPYVGFPLVINSVQKIHAAAMTF
ncbi:carboxymuconolactone decarboxylase family protein [Lactiplantibacillus herbarum]|uniref:carboxymuconolactone decarboxylase family protein n=1 Tax=Lactiplantibacillus herbarum TaxID=1670446 RepID=UPI00064E92BD|nr:carboxymuconolactone decarboxylase family protein [Lactiplantibacillus herbarum]